MWIGKGVISNTFYKSELCLLNFSCAMWGVNSIFWGGPTVLFLNWAVSTFNLIRPGTHTAVMIHGTTHDGYSYRRHEALKQIEREVLLLVAKWLDGCQKSPEWATPRDFWYCHCRLELQFRNLVLLNFFYLSSSSHKFTICIFPTVVRT